MDLNKYPNLKGVLSKYRNVSDVTDKLYHATTLSSAKKILKNGIQRDYYGDIHGRMEISPNENVVYLSKHNSSNNLNTDLFKSGEQVVVIEIDASFFDKKTKHIYPDDGMFCAFGNEQYLEDAEEVAEVLSIPLEEAESLFEEMCDQFDDQLADFLKPLALLYLDQEGEISFAGDVLPEAITRIYDYKTGVEINPSDLRERSRLRR